MPGTDAEIIAHLNEVLKTKLTGINQYFLHARMLKHMGNLKLADYQYKASIDIMKHSDMLVENILSLGGFPNLQELGKLMIGNTVKSMLSNDLALSETALKQIRLAIALCESKADSKTALASLGVLRRIIDGQQEHIDFIRTQLTSLSAQIKQKDCA